MSKLSEYAVKSRTETRKFEDLVVENFMGGNSYKLSPLQTLKIVAASSIFGEPQYYKDGLKSDATIKNHGTLLKYSILSDIMGDSTSAADVFTHAIDASLDYDFKGTLDLATELRTTFYMRLNPAVIFIRASVHQKRTEFNESNPGYMKKVGKSIAFRPDDLTNQFEYFMYINKTKNKLSSVVKRTWAEKLGEYSRYQLNKYKGKSLIDLVRISHAWNNDIDELMKTGSIKVEETEKTWETLRSAGKSWKEILESISVPHMALLRNLRGIFKEIEDIGVAKSVMTKLADGVQGGKQFPFRYWSAYQAIENESEINHKGIILDGLENCMDTSVLNMPKLEGKTICLSDNSGSSWGQLNSEYGKVHVAEIANLSSLITGKQSDEGEIGLFGDRLIIEPVSKRNGLLSQLKLVNSIERDHSRLGGGTENGIWIFFDQAIKEKKHYDNIFVYSDMQAGHGGLYGIKPSEYQEHIHGGSGRYIDVLSLVSKYRKEVNPKVNVFSVQVAGYDNTVLPENLYRGAILAGWTGKEPIFAKSLIDTWNEIEAQ
jgi:hypothetical protein